MAVMTRASHPKALWPGIKRWWGINYEKNEKIWSKIFETQTSTQAWEEDVESVGFGLMSVKTESGSIAYDTAQQGTVSRYNHRTFALGYQVTMEELEDNLYEKVSMRRSARLAQSVYETEETVHAMVFNRAFNSSFAGGDGVELLSAAHPTASGLQSNKLAVGADLSEASIEDMLTQIRLATNSRGLRIAIKARSLIVPAALEFEAHRIVKSVLQNDTANNAVNVLKMMNVFPDGITVWNYLTDPDAWYVKTNASEGLTHYTRKAATFDQDNDFDTKNLKASVVARWSEGWSDWRGLYGSEGA